MMWDLFNKTPTTDVASWCAKNEKAQTKRVEKLMTFFVFKTNNFVFY
jgi:hypothetical protein